MSSMKNNWNENIEIQIFQEYLRIPTSHPDVSYEQCVEFLLKQAESLNLTANVFYPKLQTKPVVVMTWLGAEPNLQSIMLNSHMDVVPVVEKYWSHPPFEAEIDNDGRIFARGTQDMKSVGMQYLAAVRSLQLDKIQLRRTIHIVYTPDEEVGGDKGMEAFVHTTEFKALNVGFCLDEGMASESDVFPVFYGEKFVWRINLKCVGKSGHASLFLEDTAIGKIHYLMGKFLSFRASEEQRLKDNRELTVGDVTSVNITMINGGVQLNVVPPEITMHVNVRMSVTIDYEQFERDIHEWCLNAGDDIDVYIEKLPRIEPTKIDSKNEYWMAFKHVLEDELKLKIRPQIFPGATDSRHLREINIPVIGFSPMNHTPVLLHEHDEFIKASTYIEGIEIYKQLLPKIANI